MWFEQFTNLYEIPKTLRFELKPIWNTENLIKENKIIELDKEKRQKYDKVKPYFNKIHREFINFCLNSQNIEFSKLFEVYVNYSKNKKNKDLKKLKESTEKEYLEKIGNLFDENVKSFLQEKNILDFINEKDLSLDFLYRKEIFEVLQYLYWNEAETYDVNQETWELTNSIFDGWNNWLGYFEKFFNTRKNFYKTDWTSTAIPTRIIKDNFWLFADNILILQKIKEKINFWEVEKNFSVKVENIFEIDYFNKCFTQDWIDFYNKIIGWETLENGEKLQWLNEIVNKFRQDTGEKLPFFKKLQNQILSWEKISFISQIEDSWEFFEVLKGFYENSLKKVEFLKNVFESIWNHSDENYRKIYLNKIAFNTISHKFWDALEFERILYEAMKKEKVEWIKFEKTENKYKFPDFISIFYIKKALENYKEEKLFWKERYYLSDENKDWFLERENKNLWEQFCQILHFEFSNILKRKIFDEKWEEKEIWFEIAQKKLAEKLKNFEFDDKEVKSLIKDFADLSLVLYSFGKYFSVEKWRNWDLSVDLDNDFYNWKDWYIENFYETWYDEIVKPYNLMRNYISKKPWDDNKKIKLYFWKPSLLKWFTESKTETSYNGTQYWWYLFRKKNHQGLYEYFLWVSKSAFLFRKDEELDCEEITEYERLNYYQILLRSIYGATYDGDYKDDKEKLPEWEVIAKIKKSLSTYLSKVPEFQRIIDDDSFNLKTLHNEIERVANSKWLIFEYWKTSKKQFDDAYEKWFYFFQIFSKDLYSTKNIKNLHSLYFLQLMNWEQKSFNLWVGELFFRDKISDKFKIYKQNKSGENIVSHKRFFEDKILFHLSITQNYWTDTLPKKKALYIKSFNQKINEFLANNPDINILWIDRWEKHLAYFSVIDQKWEILESGSFNCIYNFDSKGNIIKKQEKKIKEIRKNGEIVDYELVETENKIDYIDYKLLLEYKELKRKIERQTWKEVEQIKDLKKWYISLLVRKIADLIIKYNAIVVFEDLNFRFKQIRGGIEKSIYQQLEKALIDKLSFLVNKNELDSEKAWNLLKAYQLAIPVDSLKDIWKQTWVIFYTEASYTSKIDPITWWRPNLYLKKQSAEINKENILKFNKIIFNQEKDRFEITYDLKKFLWKDSLFPKNTIWALCSCVERFKWDRNLNNNKWWYRHYENLTDDFIKLFDEYNIDKNGNILEQIKSLEIKWNEKFFREFIDLFSLLCQIRNTNEKENWNDNDFILSPVEPFFDSRKSEMFGKNLPKNGDENWAYNIARKWIMILERISENFEKPDLLVRNVDWDNFVVDCKGV